ncbi:hypothetical protein [Glycomyces sp. NPDC048151]|uniref:hypothetical protein n=1 Tax=Glycomyces sp. NPDC048151 TaxID=3364002 RepID=UPI003719A582
MTNSAKGVFGAIAAVVGVVASIVGILVGVQQLRGGDNPPEQPADTTAATTGAPAEAGTEEDQAAPASSSWTQEGDGGELVLSKVVNSSGECQYLHVDFDAGVEGTIQPAATSGLRVEDGDDLIWNPCENGDGLYVASLTSAGTAVGAALDAAAPSPEDCMDAVTAAGGANAALNIQLSFADDGATGLSAGTSLCVWNTETGRLTVASSESMREAENGVDEIITYWVTTYLPA